MRVIVLILVALAVLTFTMPIAYSHPSHSFTTSEGYIPNILRTEEDFNRVSTQSAAKGQKNKDAFYGNAKTKKERAEIDLARQAGLASKSNEGFVADLKLAGFDIMTRLSCLN